MKKRRRLKTIPLFHSDEEEVSFWDRVDSTEYFSGQGQTHLRMPPRNVSISLRLPERLISRLKKLADAKDVPYQSLLKIYVDEKVREEILLLKKIA